MPEAVLRAVSVTRRRLCGAQGTRSATGASMPRLFSASTTLPRFQAR